MRSLLFVPGDSARKLEKALASQADALLIDLEDSVSLEAKDEARSITAEFLQGNVAGSGRPRLYVRINGLSTGLAEADLDWVMPAAPDGVVLPKAVGGADVAALAALLSRHEAGNVRAATRILAIATENAAGVFALGTFAGSSDRLVGLAWGGEDLSADLGAASNRTDSGAYADPYRLARTLTLLGAASAGVAAIDAVYTNFRDMAGLEAECREARRDGFVGKMAIHPAQVPIINAAFAPTTEEIARARAVVAAFADNPGAGVVGVDGEMLDRPHLLRAERLLARAGEVI
ncbi:CoA ester lyase [Rhizobium sp. TRM96647]|uniref:HpcH/HpaI aldolase/citrate lyase family protein n=1 Tax=unclassified Rhizobium TaxID=2613769 RepID=UPI0021E90ED2|nr:MULTISPECIES: CoA ester lyase [unclassified Rhizobium]MCV3738795.1 CoA ester lyase [Rhizobium sp. TRM96647]MCV3760498.1 CoA ester lyase [Rhizobium sp. TRM96650]